MFAFYLNLCIAIFLLHAAYACYRTIFPDSKSLYAESKPGFWAQAVMLSIPFVNIVLFLVILYFYATLPAKLWNDE
jgi:hypothetical protein